MTFRHMLGLSRPRLCLLAALATVAGYAVRRPEADSGILLAGFGALLLAAGSGALNQAQERHLDALMSRTAARPLASGAVTLAGGVAFACACLAGSLVLLARSGPAPAFIWATVLVLYNGVYTPLKRRTPFAILAGGVAGAMPPLLGWCAAGGEPTDFRPLLLCGVLYLWQVPHFWMLARRHAEDYKRAGFPVLAANAHSGRALAWAWALAASVMLLPALGMVGSTLSSALLVALALSLALSGVRPGAGRGFAALNLGMLAVLCILTFDAFLHS